MSKQLKAEVDNAVRALAENRGATLEAVALQPALMTLECVIAEARDDVRAGTSLDVLAAIVAAFLEEAADALEEHPHAGTEPNRSAAARAALGLEPGTQGKPLRGTRGEPGRIGTVARWLAYDSASLFKKRQDGRSPFDVLLEDVAEQLVRREVAHQVGERRAMQLARRLPLESAMKIDWLARFECYYRLWSPLSGMRNDINAAVAHHQSGDADELDYFSRKALYYYSWFLWELHAFQHAHGGLWILPDPAAEQTIADATWMLRKPLALTELDDSILRLAIDGWPELAHFVQATYRDAALRRIISTWTDWLASCACSASEDPADGCLVHECLLWTDSFADTLDAQWDQLADWYAVDRPSSAVDTHLEHAE